MWCDTYYDVVVIHAHCETRIITIYCDHNKELIGIMYLNVPILVIFYNTKI